MSENENINHEHEKYIKRKEGLQGAGYSLLILCFACGIGAWFIFFRDPLGDTIWHFIINICAPFAIFGSLIIGIVYLFQSILQAITGKGDVMEKINALISNTFK